MVTSIAKAYCTGRARRHRRVLLVVTALASLLLANPDLIAGTVSFGNNDYWGLSGSSGWRRSPPQWSSPSAPTTGPDAGTTGTGSNAAAGAGASLSGFVWYDPDRDGVFDDRDSPIHDAHMLLYEMNDLDHPVATVYTDSNGIYQFAGLAAGSYALALGYPTSPGGQDFVGKLLDQQDAPVSSGAGTLVAEKDMVVNIVLGAGYKGQSYDFAEVVCPISKRYFVTTPEPGAMVLLAGAALGGALAWFLRRGTRTAVRRRG